MLTRAKIDALSDIAENGDSDDVRPALKQVLAEIKAQRAIVIAALGCTGEDGHDGIVDLSCAAEEYLDELAKKDPRWATADWQTRDALIQERK